MALRPQSSLDDRRRRVLSGEVAASPSSQGQSPDGEAAAPKRRSSRKQNPRYTQAARVENQLRVIDLVPQRPWVVAIWLALGLLAVAGLESLYFYMPQIGGMTTDGRVAAFDLDGEGSLAGWFSSAVLALCGLTAILIYILRKQRIDDYRGRYRVWLWAAGLWFVMSIDESGSLHEGFKELMTWLTGRTLFGDGSLWWVIAYGSLLSVLGLRLVLDLRESWPATLAFLATGTCYALAVVLQLQLLLPDRGVLGVMAEEACEMAGDVLLLLSMSLYARFLIRDIQGVYELRHSQKAERLAHKTAAREAKAAAADEKRKAAAAAIKAREEEAAAKTKSRADQIAAKAQARADEAAARTAAKEAAAQEKQAAKTAAAQRTSAERSSNERVAAQSDKKQPSISATSGGKSATSALSSSKPSSSAAAGGLFGAKSLTTRIDPAEQDAAAGAHLSKAQRKALKRRQEMEERMKK